MAFPERLVALRKARGLNQRTLGERIGIHLSQIQRYEAGDSQPTLDVIRRLAVFFSVSADTLIFEDDERGPHNEKFRLLFEALGQLAPQEQEVAKEVLQSLITRYQAQRANTARPED